MFRSKSKFVSSVGSPEVQQLLNASDPLHPCFVKPQNEAEKRLSILNDFFGSLKTNSSSVCLKIDSVSNAEFCKIINCLKANQTVRKLRLFLSIDEQWALLLGDMLKQNKVLKRLRLARISELGAVVLAYALKTNRVLIELRCLDGDVSHQIKCILQRNRKLCELPNVFGSLTNNDINVTDLDLTDYDLSSSDIRSLAEALKHNTSLLRIRLNNRSVSSDDARVLASALESNTCLIRFGLHQGWGRSASVMSKINHSIERNKKAAAKIEFERCLSVLQADEMLCEKFTLASLYIDNEGARRIASCIQLNKHLTFLDLRCNKITDKGAAVLGDALISSKRPIVIELAGNPVCRAIVDHVENIGKHNQAMQQVMRNRVVINDILNSDACLYLPVELHELILQFFLGTQKVIRESKGLEDVLRREGVYEECFDSQGLPIGQCPNLRLIRCCRKEAWERDYAAKPPLFTFKSWKIVRSDLRKCSRQNEVIIPQIEANENTAKHICCMTYCCNFLNYITNCFVTEKLP